MADTDNTNESAGIKTNVLRYDMDSLLLGCMLDNRWTRPLSDNKLETVPCQKLV